MKIYVILFLMLTITTPIITINTNAQTSLEFDGNSAYAFLKAQCDFGPRPPGSQALEDTRVYIKNLFESWNWTVTFQNWTYREVQLVNIIATKGSNASVIIGAHYDTRPVADHDPDPSNWDKPIPGANDGASGVAVILELARILPDDAASDVKFVLFDAEDSGNVNGWPWIIGSTYYANSMSESEINRTRAVIILDMIGDTDLNIKREGYSTPTLVDTIWGIASHLGYGSEFQNVTGYKMLDDHRPFLDLNIPTVDIIDFDYPYWHTLQDTPEHCSAASLEAVGRTIESFLKYYKGKTFVNEQGFPYDIWFLLGISIVIIPVIAYLARRRLKHDI